MKSIVKFNLLFNDENYDRVTNPLRLNVFELLPIGMSWEHNAKKLVKKNPNKIISLLSNDGEAIAAVESPFDPVENKALVINPDASIRWDIGAVLNLNIKDNLMFSDVYYVNDELFFFFNKSGKDFRFSFDVFTGLPGKIYEAY